MKLLSESEKMMVAGGACGDVGYCCCMNGSEIVFEMGGMGSKVDGKLLDREICKQICCGKHDTFIMTPTVLWNYGKEIGKCKEKNKKRVKTVPSFGLSGFSSGFLGDGGIF